jgi:hypothetical protein
LLKQRSYSLFMDSGLIKAYSLFPPPTLPLFTLCRLTPIPFLLIPPPRSALSISPYSGQERFSYRCLVLFGSAWLEPTIVRRASGKGIMALAPRTELFEEPELGRRWQSEPRSGPSAWDDWWLLPPPLNSIHSTLVSVTYFLPFILL